MEQQNTRLRNAGFATFFFSGICAISAGVVVSLLLVYHNQKHISMQKEKSLRPTAGRLEMPSALLWAYSAERLF